MKKFIAIAALSVCASVASATTISWTNRFEGGTIGSWSTTVSDDAAALTLAPTAETGILNISNGYTKHYGATTPTSTFGADTSTFALTISSIVLMGKGGYSTPNNLHLLLADSEGNTVAISNQVTLAAASGNNGMAFYTGLNTTTVQSSGKSLTFTFDADNQAALRDADGTYNTYSVYFVTIADDETVTYYNGALDIPHFSDGTLLYDVQVLPEPGVMALLALGVGAIALKRKVA